MCIRDRDFVYYESIDDLIRKCDYYIKHEDERKAIALNGYNKVKEFHNYKPVSYTHLDVYKRQILHTSDTEGKK